MARSPRAYRSGQAFSRQCHRGRVISPVGPRIGRALVSTNRLQMLASRVQVTSGDLCKGRYITLISPPGRRRTFPWCWLPLCQRTAPWNALNFKP